MILQGPQVTVSLEDHCSRAAPSRSLTFRATRSSCAAALASPDWGYHPCRVASNEHADLFSRFQQPPVRRWDGGEGACVTPD
jgi:hypothetical protein